ncbi:MAG: hypothetical protein KDD56_08865 [Bdellovibrionales bacterium]|nr:hypothetical protein [Bdellovibrionales bacterium]
MPVLESPQQVIRFKQATSTSRMLGVFPALREFSGSTKPVPAIQPVAGSPTDVIKAIKEIGKKFGAGLELVLHTQNKLIVFSSTNRTSLKKAKSPFAFYIWEKSGDQWLKPKVITPIHSKLFKRMCNEFLPGSC